MNNSKDRIITALQTQVSLKDATSDGLIYFYGEKINGLWYFFSGPSIIIPRKMVKNHPLNKPLSYQQLHQIALKEIYGGYLKFDGSINEDWFTSHFEGPGWGDFNDQKETMKYLELPEDCVFTDRRKFYEAIHLQGVRNMWYGVKKDITLKP